MNRSHRHNHCSPLLLIILALSFTMCQAQRKHYAFVVEVRGWEYYKIVEWLWRRAAATHWSGENRRYSAFGPVLSSLTNDLEMMPFCSRVETRDPLSAKYGKMMNNKIMVMTWAMLGLGPYSWEGGDVAITRSCYCSRITVLKLSN